MNHGLNARTVNAGSAIHIILSIVLLRILRVIRMFAIAARIVTMHGGLMGLIHE